MKRTTNGALFRGDVKRSAAGRRTLALPSVAVEALRRHLNAQAAEQLAAGPAWQDENYVFTTPIGTPIDPSNLRKAFDVLTKSAGIEGVTPYVLRHSRSIPDARRRCQFGRGRRCTRGPPCHALTPLSAPGAAGGRRHEDDGESALVEEARRLP